MDNTLLVSRLGGNVLGSKLPPLSISENLLPKESCIICTCVEPSVLDSCQRAFECVNRVPGE